MGEMCRERKVWCLQSQGIKLQEERAGGRKMNWQDRRELSGEDLVSHDEIWRLFEVG